MVVEEAGPECCGREEEEEEEEVQASREGGWREGRGTEVMVVRKLGGGGGSGISKAYSHPPSCDLIFVESGGKLCREKCIHVVCK